MYGYIYKITNIINNKIYIGQTGKSIDVRFKEHLNEAFNLNTQRPLYKAMRKYGKDNFKIEIIEKVSLRDLDNKECFYIKMYDCLAIKGNGYNITYGGGGKRIDYELVRTLWDSGLSIIEICMESGYGRDAIRNALLSYPNYTTEESRRRGVLYQNTDRKRKVYQYSATGEFIAEYPNVDAAAISLKCKVGTLRAALIAPGYLGNGYQWSYYQFANIAPIDHKGRNYKQRVIEITKDGHTINTYESAAAAARALNISDNYIRNACNRKSHKCIKSERYFKYENE